MTKDFLYAVGEADGHEPRVERPFDPWRIPITPAALAFCQYAISLVETHERDFGLRKRKRRLTDQATFERTVTALLSDLSINVLCESSSGIHLTRSNRNLGYRSRYSHPATGKALRDLLDRLAHPNLNLITQDLGCKPEKGQRKRTVVRPTAKLRQLIAKHGLTPCDFGEDHRQKSIELKSVPKGRLERGTRIDYQDSNLTIRYRREMQEINCHLASAKIEIVGGGNIDLNKRRLRRSFTRESFESGGRLFGGFWQHMSKRDRLCYLRMNGEEVVELDYGQVMPRIVYALEGVVPSMHDLYDIPGFEKHRAGIKKVTSSMLFVEAPLKRFPKETRQLFPKDIKVHEVTDAIIGAHPAISKAFSTGIGHRCQFLENEILVEVLRILLGMGITALPIHDAIIVPASAVATAQKVMLYTFKRKTGLEGALDVITKEQFIEQELQLVA